MVNGHDRKFLDWLRTQPCAVTGQDWPEGGREPAHVFKSLFGGGTSRKSLRAVPLAPEEHRRQSGMSEIEYWRQAVNRDPILLKRMVGALGEHYQNLYIVERKLK